MSNKNILIIISLILIAIISIYAVNHVCNQDSKNIFIGIFSSTIVVLLIEIIYLIRDYFKYSFLKGQYLRTKITNKLDNRTPDSIYEDMTPRYNQKGVNQNINLKYIGDGEYRGTIYYEEGTAKFIINLNQDNPNAGTGTYQYIEKQQGYTMPDLGTYKIQVDISDKNIIYIYYSNILPNGLASGYEIWQKNS